MQTFEKLINCETLNDRLQQILKRLTNLPFNDDFMFCVAIVALRGSLDRINEHFLCNKCKTRSLKISSSYRHYSGLLNLQNSREQTLAGDVGELSPGVLP